VALKSGDRVEVKWLDAFSINDTWHELEEKGRSKRFECVTLGYLTEIDEEYIRVVQTVSDGDSPEEDQQVAGIFSIPLGCILEVIKIDKGKKVKV